MSIDLAARRLSVAGCNASRKRRFSTDPARRAYYAKSRAARFTARLSK